MHHPPESPPIEQSRLRRTAVAAPDAAWLSALRDGMPDALERCFREYSPALVLLATRLTGEPADAEDVVQDVFVGLPEALHRYEERGAFGAWLRRLTARHALSRMRRAKNRREDSLTFVALNLSATSAPDSEESYIERALLALPATQRQVFVLRVIEEHTHAEIAQLLGIGVAASEVRLSRAIKALRTLLGDLR